MPIQSGAITFEGPMRWLPRISEGALDEAEAITVASRDRRFRCNLVRNLGGASKRNHQLM